MYKKNEGISENDRLQNRFSSYVSMSIHRERMLYIKRKVRRLEFEVVLDEIHFNIADSTNFPDDFCDNDSLTYALQKLSAKERHIFLTHAHHGLCHVLPSASRDDLHRMPSRHVVEHHTGMHSVSR